MYILPRMSSSPCIGCIHNGLQSRILQYQQPAADLHTVAGPALEAIRSVYGPAVARELLEFEASSETPDSANFKLAGLISNANYSVKKCVFILFINHRLVESASLKRAVEEVYSEYLPRHTHPVVYVSLELPPLQVDVNVHPTKREVCRGEYVILFFAPDRSWQQVHFLHEEEIIAALQASVQKHLLGANRSRTFYTQAVLPLSEADFQDGISSQAVDCPTKTSEEASNSKPSIAPQKPDPKPSIAPQKLVRTDALNPAGSLDAFMLPASGTASRKKTRTTRVASDKVEQNEDTLKNGDSENEDTFPAKRARVCELSSVQGLLDEVDRRRHAGLSKLLRRHTYVGMVDDELSIMQHNTKLYLVNHHELR